MIANEDWLVIGIITSSHGVAGKLNIKSLSDFEERFTQPGERWIQKNDEEPMLCKLTSGFQKPGKESFIISLDGVKDRNEADKLKTPTNGASYGNKLSHHLFGVFGSM